MFSGEFEYTMDDKGRVCLPAECGAELGSSVIICRGMDHQLNVYPKIVWDRNLERLAKQDWGQKSVRDASRIAFSASECEIDRQNRILIPPWLRQHAELDTTVVIVGMNDHLEIWNPGNWCDLLNRLQGGDEEITEELARLGLKL